MYEQIKNIVPAGGISQSQAALPPVFGAEYAETAQKDELTRVFISPVRIIWKSGDVVNEDVLLKKGGSQAAMGAKNTCAIKSGIGDTASILLDYGKEIHGGLQLVMGSSSRREPSLVRIRFGESVGEANSTTLNSEWKVGFSTDDHAKRDIVMEIPRDGLIEIGNTGFRFVRIDLLQSNTTIRLREARAVLRFRDIPYLGSFRSSDERLDKIWLTGAYTVHLNMQEYLWDGIKRDRLVWLGDMHPEVATIIRVFGANEVIPKSLDYACEQYPLPAWMNGMSAYSLWYLIIHYEWYMHSGDLDFLKKHRDYILGLIAQIDGKVDEKGVETLAPSRFLDWPSSPNQAGVEAGYRALIVWAMHDAEKLCKILDEPDFAVKAAHCAEKMNKHIAPHNNLKQAAALMAIADILDAQKACNEVISVGGAQGFSTFYGYYMLQAQAKAGQYQNALDIIRQYWGGMLDMGATTFWEDFDLKWTENAARLDEITPAGKQDIHGDFGAYCYPGFRHSLCHGWSSGPTAWLTEYVLGIKAVDAGCRTVKIEPHLADLQWVEGSFPTPYGIIKVRHTKDKNGKTVSEISAPKEVKIIKN
ncbi:MAG: alpha-L-rhamnosidase [Dysgonamonadaceae bacterium]|nr:alpha-L-rhamnosidase [Dysgonamonadaceae bacterium]